MKKPAKPGTEDLEARLVDMERKLERLRGLYESYFMGIERAPPNTPRRELNRLILEMQQDHIGNASLRFRFQSVIQRWVLFTTYWNRTMREIEAGTYSRDIKKAQRHLAERGGSLTEEQARALGIPANRVKAFLDRHNKTQARTGGAPAGPAKPAAAQEPARIQGVKDGDIENVYKLYLETHKRVGDPRPPPTLDKLRERLAAQIPKILAERGGNRVKLDIAVEDGKVRLKAWPVKE